MKISAFTQIIVTVAVTAWVFILPVMAVATILVLELALLLSIKHDRMTMAASRRPGGIYRLMVLCSFCSVRRLKLHWSADCACWL